MENVKAKIHQWFNLPYKLHSSVKGTGPPIIMLHGIATSSKSWENIIPLLEPYYRCITIDLLGFGVSPKPDWYSYTPDEHIINIYHTIKQMKLKEPFILMGHSMGSLLAIRFAATYPDQVKCLVSLSPPFYLTSQQADNAKMLWRETLYANAYQYLRTHKKFTLNSTRNLKKLMIRKNQSFINEQTWHSFSKSLEECIEKQNVVKDLGQIHCPINIFYGTLDQLLIKKNIKSCLQFSNVSIRTVRSGHMLNLPYSRLVAQTLIKEKF